MNFFKRAWQNISFKKGRSLLLVIVMTVILVFIMAGLLIRNAAVTTVNNTKQQVGASVTLSANRDQAFKKMRSLTPPTSTSKTKKPSLSMPSVSLANVKKIAALSGVANYNVSVATSANASSIDAISTSSASNNGPMGMSQSTSSGDLQITGVLNMKTLSDFKDNTNKITKGRALTSADVNTNNVVIESELAKQNDLSVGDTIKIKATTTGKKAYTLKVVGIYKASQSSSSSMGPQQSDPSNTLYTAYTLANQIKGQTNKVDSAVFTLSNPTQKTAFLKAAKKIINTKKFSLTADDSTYQALKQSMQKMESFANKIVWLVAIAGTVILALIIILIVRERRYEMGVLLSLGEKRTKIIGQLLVEMFMLLIVSLALAGIGGQFAGQALSKQVMSSVTTSTTTDSATTQPGGNGGPGGGQAPSGQPGGNRPGGQMTQGTQNKAKSIKASDLNLKINPLTLLQLGAFGFTIIAFAVLLASANILRLEPRKILIG
ncbi:ABC transporter permease [Latilactobacillus sakei]|uniref:ABC transporter permease n=1 Tax=Latilactobacillus sakei TaxID=1599 RepID=UPI000503BDE9|nr:ABC transporter permease [Latilactobacillus sakei]AST84369.1 ABC transporter permease [Latilactobacillus sakei]AWZ42317.1 ABC transporter permease [Latilactobacillus sakei]AWZ46513.1 ABC transporter permease [Latilactobacillus sakei]AYG15699.1 ABC transporter permease [Latilactobacillus sakei]AYG26211.1 ABC transporter permease [Latilactobacillus sakei]